MTEKIIERAILTCNVTKAEGDSDRVLTFDGSTEAVDRMDEVIMADGWDLANYKKNPVFMWAHNYSMPPIGRSVRTWVDKAAKALKFKVEFADAETYPFADTIYRLYKAGFMKAVSVGFIPLETEVPDEEGTDSKGKKAKQPSRRYLRQELLELSAAPVPANPEALQNAVTAGVIMAKELDMMEATKRWGPEPSTHWLEGMAASTERLRMAADAIVNIRADGLKLTGELLGETADETEAAPAPSDATSGPQPSKAGPSETGLDQTIDGADATTKIEETDEFIKIPVKGEEGKHKDHAIKHITVSKKEGINGLYCIDCKTVITFIFMKASGWTKAKAIKWMEDHGHRAHWLRSFPDARKDIDGDVDDYPTPGLILRDVPQGLWGPCPHASQESLMDDMTYLITQLKAAGISEKAAAVAVELAGLIERLTGSDIPDNIAGDAPLDMATEASPLIQQAVKDAIREVLQPLITNKE